MVYLDGEELLAIHARIIQRTGGRQGVRDMNVLRSMFHRPKTTVGGSAVYQDLWSKAAAYFEGFAMFHVFVDGNKRTGLVATMRFLWLNGYELSISNQTAVRFTRQIIKHRFRIAVIAAWLKTHSRRRRTN